MKTAYIIHGWDGSPNEPMHKWLKKSLEDLGYMVVAPIMPESEIPRIDSWVGKLKEIVKPDQATISIGHSIGCQAILRYLETLPTTVKIPFVIMIAPWMDLDRQTLKEEGEEAIEIAKPWIETLINFDEVKKRAENFVAIFSDNDYCVPLNQKELFKEKLAAKIIIEHNQGHFTAADKVKKLPSALSAVSQSK